jgi:hypothetical protein
MKSNLCVIEWPPGSKRLVEIPEVDWGGWFSIPDAKSRILKSRQPLLDILFKGSAIQSDTAHFASRLLAITMLETGDFYESGRNELLLRDVSRGRTRGTKGSEESPRLQSQSASAWNTSTSTVPHGSILRCRLLGLYTSQQTVACGNACFGETSGSAVSMSFRDTYSPSGSGAVPTMISKNPKR